MMITASVCNDKEIHILCEAILAKLNSENEIRKQEEKVSGVMGE